ncbi:hypothetical protein OnM2_014029 [Erysiphe neolycopersici]|uniref:Uncharacterized protein n=1 Tax=Erysiphe neolycopersici TaxID=212602 RepID=A0A420I5P2_9PEZI|nr:hypothetical protein OnM2_014029 [Erysiphe neolycopersici]
MFSLIDQISILCTFIVFLIVACALFLCLGDKIEQRRLEEVVKLDEDRKERLKERELRELLSWRDSIGVEGLGLLRN